MTGCPDPTSSVDTPSRDGCPSEVIPRNNACFDLNLFRPTWKHCKCKIHINLSPCGGLLNTSATLRLGFGLAIPTHCNQYFAQLRPDLEPSELPTKEEGIIIRRRVSMFYRAENRRICSRPFLPIEFLCTGSRFKVLDIQARPTNVRRVASNN